MEKKIRPVIIRLTESQFQALADYLVEEERTKSSVIRDALNKYLIENSPKKENKKKK